MSEKNRQWLLKRHPEGRVVPGDFEYRETDVPDGPLKDGEILIRNVVLLCAPTMRNWMDPPGNSGYPAVPLGAPMMAPCTARVVKSAHPDFPEGCRVATTGGWQDYQVIDPDVMMARRLPDGISFVDGMGRYGLNPLTGYFGMLKVGHPEAGDTVLVSAAAGSTGSVAAQVARIRGCRVIGIAGGAEKCAWLTGECRLADAIDYKSEDVAARVAELCPDGIDVFYDNVGGEQLQVAVDNMKRFGRIVLCGQIASYNAGEQPEGPRNMMRLIYSSITMQGFLGRDYAAEFPQAIEQLKAWTESGELVQREDVRDGFDKVPETYVALFDGANRGTLMATIDASARETS